MKKNRLRSQKKAKSGNVLKTFLMSFAVVGVIYSGILINQIDMPEILPVENIEVIGDMRFIDKSKIVAILERGIDGGYFTIDLPGLRQSLLREPWVKDVSLRRKWPAGISVFVEEKIPVAYWNNDEYISESGEVFKPEKRMNNLVLPVLNGPQGHHGDVWKFMNELYSEMALQEYQVIRLDLDDRRAWQLVITIDAGSFIAGTGGGENKGIVVKLGRFDTEKRLQRFVRILPVLMAEGRMTVTDRQAADATQIQKLNKDSDKKYIDVIDMRYPNGFAVQLSSRRMSEA